MPASVRLGLATAVLLGVVALAYVVAVRQPLLMPAVVAGQPAPRASSARPGALAGAAATPAKAPEPEPEPAPCPPQRTVLSAGNAAARRPVVVRHYVGTVGGQAATATLQWQTPDSATGTFYLHRGGPEYSLAFSQPGLAEVYDDQGGIDALRQGTWQLATGVAGPLLAGTWRRAGRVQQLRLRESYAGALRYTFTERTLFDGYRVPEHCDYVPEMYHLLLVLPSPRGAPPVLRTRLAGSPAALRRRIRQDCSTHDNDATGTYTDEVRLNAFHLFSYQTSSYVRAYGGTPDVGTESWLFDLRTGKKLTIASQLKPGYKHSLRQHLTWHFLHDPVLEPDRRAGFGDWTTDKGSNTPLLSLPKFNEALTLTGAGLEAAYGRHTLVLVPYRELRPLVRSGTPLARMLRARGLW
jgi:hypothetical protein